MIRNRSSFPGFRRGVGALAALVLMVGSLCGCAYRLGTTSGLEPGSRSIAVMPFENATYEPRVTESISTALREQLQQEGTYKLARRDDADVILTGVVRSITRSEQSFQFQDTRHVRDYRLEIVAQVTATERGTGKKLLERELGGHTTMRVLSDLPSAERQAMPLLAANLARNITSVLVDGSW
ncbi:MAG: hypothetical protein JNK85_03415 [Verrucomicrobiales bacterium]|nr:hypothetical protein [Verrucomicrobiales bacterium]